MHSLRSSSLIFHSHSQAAHTETGITTLMVAAAKGLVDVCQRLLDSDADIGYGVSPCMFVPLISETVIGLQIRVGNADCYILHF